ncbi:hypothetical protein BOTBODRAFT_65779 [Botryobasidium botryosum FD-172 SS1]|uniref:Uncharacterized protein n=1 Tax=Botryobasidium botryosum (strain FD-172 SS1) TaxID=930990 RepID=A0A067MSJ0_BOTB1|nr:hypothetical protein BOTBODRAFT_65779 [Botryobasidium botryosum FD-172 SS1]
MESDSEWEGSLFGDEADEGVEDVVSSQAATPAPTVSLALPPFPGRSAPTNDPGSRGETRHENVGTIALPVSPTPIEPVSANSDPSPKRPVRPPAARVDRRPVPELPPLPAAGPIPANYFRSQPTLLGHAGIVAQLVPQNLPSPTPLGSSSRNPIVIPDTDNHPSASHSQPWTALARTSSASTNSPIFTALSDLIESLSANPALNSTLRPLLALLHPPPQSRPATPSDSKPKKRRRLNHVPSGAESWDVPYPFADGDGPKNYMESWSEQKIKHFLLELISVIRKALQAAERRTRGSDQARPILKQGEQRVPERGFAPMDHPGAYPSSVSTPDTMTEASTAASASPPSLAEPFSFEQLFQMLGSDSGASVADATKGFAESPVPAIPTGADVVEPSLDDLLLWFAQAGADLPSTALNGPNPGPYDLALSSSTSLPVSDPLLFDIPIDPALLDPLASTALQGSAPYPPAPPGPPPALFSTVPHSLRAGPNSESNPTSTSTSRSGSARPSSSRDIIASSQRAAPSRQSSVASAAHSNKGKARAQPPQTNTPAASTPVPNSPAAGTPVQPARAAPLRQRARALREKLQEAYDRAQKELWACEVEEGMLINLGRALREGGAAPGPGPGPSAARASPAQLDENAGAC